METQGPAPKAVVFFGTAIMVLAGVGAAGSVISLVLKLNEGPGGPVGGYVLILVASLLVCYLWLRIGQGLRRGRRNAATFLNILTLLHLLVGVGTLLGGDALRGGILLAPVVLVQLPAVVAVQMSWKQLR